MRFIIWKSISNNLSGGPSDNHIAHVKNNVLNIHFDNQSCSLRCLQPGLNVSSSVAIPSDLPYDKYWLKIAQTDHLFFILLAKFESCITPICYFLNFLLMTKSKAAFCSSDNSLRRKAIISWTLPCTQSGVNLSIINVPLRWSISCCKTLA